MDNLDVLYRDIILEHSNRVFDEAVAKNRASITVYNRACGDSVSILKKHNVISCYPQGCSICMASASMLDEVVQGKDQKSVKLIIKSIKTLITKGDVSNELKNSDLEALSGVSQFPNRIKCALLPWEALERLLENGKI